jgi:hypothetical protein
VNNRNILRRMITGEIFYPKWFIGLLCHVIDRFINVSNELTNDGILVVI